MYSAVNGDIFFFLSLSMKHRNTMQLTFLPVYPFQFCILYTLFVKKMTSMFETKGYIRLQERIP